MKTDENFMSMALTLAERGWGRTNPNPLVGAVIVKDGQVIADGCHALLGEEHAERAALRCAKESGVSVQGASLYVNLEPCSHVGRTPPCTAAIIEQGIREVVVAMVDPNPLVSGKGIRQLQEAGIQVRVGVLEKEAARLNEIFIKYITAHAPFVIMKAAMTLDGKIATEKGDSHWISGEFSRQKVHRLRDRVAAIMVGIKTVLADNPSLTTRLATGNGRDPLRIVVDSQGQIPLDSKVVQTPSSAGLILATTHLIHPDKERQLQENGVLVWKLDGPDGHVDLNGLMHRLADKEIDSVLLEGGGELNAAALKAGLVDKVMIFVAPKIIGGAQAKTAVEGKGISRMQDAICLKDMSFCASGGDLLIEGYPSKPSPDAY